MVGRPFVGAQVPAISFLDEGIEAVFDRLVDEVRANTVIIPAYGYDPGLISRGADDRVDHGVHEPDQSRGGSFTTPRAQYYQSGLLRAVRSPEAVYEGFDVLEAITPAARERRMSVYIYILEEAPAGRTLPQP